MMLVIHVLPSWAT